MELAKIFLYAKKEMATTFIVTRNYLFPFYVVMSISKYCRFPDGTLMPTNGWNYSFQGALWILAALHVYWASLLLKMLYSAIVNKGVEDDIRNVEDKKKNE
ncbi:hypothetical protein HDV01_007013 [Terramyces sp. JEL0728]|nr:hypothetical protein HDV01_007013 [Terramyces sp. JEL0728]